MTRSHRHRTFAALAVLAVAALAVLSLAGAPAAAQGAGLERYIVQVEPGADGAVLDEARALGGRFVEPLEFIPDTFVVALSFRAADALAGRAGVLRVERDQMMHLVHHQCGHDRPVPYDGSCGAGTLTGTVTDVDGGAAIEGANVTVAGTSLSTTTDGDGDYTIENVPEGDHDVTASADGYTSQTHSATIVDGEPTELHFTLEAVTENEEDSAGDQVTPWGIAKIQAPDAWGTTQGAGSGVCVADTGIDKNHEDLDYVRGRNFAGGGPFSSPNNDDYGDGNGHGTHVAGTVAALDNEVGVVGVAPEASLYIAKVLKDNGSGWISQIANGLHWCAEQGADEHGPGVHIINMSFGGGDSSTLHDAIKYAANQGLVLVAASGNSGASQPGYPARYDEVIAVGATNDQDQIASWSNRDEDVNAPGVGVLSTVPGGYATFSGTSMASPHVAGVAALIIAAGEGDPETVRAIITCAADEIADVIRVNAYNAVTADCPAPEAALRFEPGRIFIAA